MLLAASALKGYAIEASDGRMGSVNDLLFDDRSWKVRWMVIETGNWLSQRKVLVHPSAIRAADYESQVLTVTLTKAQVEASPDIGQDQPVSQQMESRIFDHYGWDPYLGPNYFLQDNLMMDTAGLPSGSPFMGGTGRREAARLDIIRDDGDPHLRSMAAVTGYHIHATDGVIGHVENFLIEDAGWGIRYLVADTRNWWPGQHVLLSPYAVRRIEWGDREILLDVTRERVKNSPAWNPAEIIDQDYEQRLHSHYGWHGHGF